MFLSLKICFGFGFGYSVCVPVCASCGNVNFHNSLCGILSQQWGSGGEATGSLKFSTSSFYKFSFLPESDEPFHPYIRRCGSRAPEL